MAGERSLTMHVLTVTTFFPNSGDPHRTVFLHHLVRAMKQRCELTMVAPMRWHAHCQVPRREEVRGITVQHPRFPAIPKLFFLSGLGFFVGIFSTLRRFRREHPQGLVHVHCAYPDAVGVALAAKLLGLPYVVTAHGSDINVHTRRPSLAPQIRWALKGARGIVAVSRALAERIRTVVPQDLPPIECIPCAGFDPAIFVACDCGPARQSLGVAQSSRVVAFVGSLLPIKNVDVLIDAWRQAIAQGQLRSTDCLVLIGDGSERAGLERAVRQAGLAAQVRFTGALPQSDVALWLSAADVLCLPSQNEGMPNVIVEALAMGLPVVASRVGGIPELVQDGVNGYLVPARDVAALSEALSAALAKVWCPTQLRESVNHLTWRSLAERNCEFLRTVQNLAATTPASASIGEA
jgi:glycosyltransferase involved in cell wall biosynthesis